MILSVKALLKITVDCKQLHCTHHSHRNNWKCTLFYLSTWSEKEEFYICYVKQVCVCSMRVLIRETNCKKHLSRIHSWSHFQKNHLIDEGTSPFYMLGSIVMGNSIRWEHLCLQLISSEPCRRPSASHLAKLFHLIKRNICTAVY